MKQEYPKIVTAPWLKLKVRAFMPKNMDSAVVVDKGVYEGCTAIPFQQGKQTCLVLTDQRNFSDEEAASSRYEAEVWVRFPATSAHLFDAYAHHEPVHVDPKDGARFARLNGSIGAHQGTAFLTQWTGSEVGVEMALPEMGPLPDGREAFWLPSFAMRVHVDLLTGSITGVGRAASLMAYEIDLLCTGKGKVRLSELPAEKVNLNEGESYPYRSFRFTKQLASIPNIFQQMAKATGYYV